MHLNNIQLVDLPSHNKMTVKEQIMHKIRVTVEYTTEIEYPGTVDEFTEEMDTPEKFKTLIKKIVKESPSPTVHYSDEKSRREAEMHERMEQVFCNVGEDTFPDNLFNFAQKYPISYCNEDDKRHPGKCLVIWEPFENFTIKQLINYIKGNGLWT